MLTLASCCLHTYLAKCVYYVHYIYYCWNFTTVILRMFKCVLYVDIWLDFLKFEVECNTAESLLNANNIYWKARKTLKKELISEFTTKHSLLRSK